MILQKNIAKKIPLVQLRRKSGAGSESLLGNSKGIALMEGTIVLPFLIALFVCVIDLGNLLNQYLLLTNAVNSGVRFGIGVSSLKVGSFEKLTPNQTCPFETEETETHQYDAGHKEIQQKVYDFVQFQNVALDSDFCMITDLERDSAVPTRGSLSILLKTRFAGISPFFSNITLEISAKGPYLMEIPTS